jgi:hypothetical protein
MRYLLVEKKTAIIDTLLAEMFGLLQYRKGRVETPRAAGPWPPGNLLASLLAEAGTRFRVPRTPDVG